MLTIVVIYFCFSHIMVSSVSFGFFFLFFFLLYTFGNVIESVRSFRSLELVLFNARRHYSSKSCEEWKTNKKRKIDTRKKNINTGQSQKKEKNQRTEPKKKKKLYSCRYILWCGVCLNTPARTYIQNPYWTVWAGCRTKDCVLEIYLESVAVTAVRPVSCAVDWSETRRKHK